MHPAHAGYFAALKQVRYLHLQGPVQGNAENLWLD